MRYDSVTVLVGANYSELAEEEEALIADIKRQGGWLEFIAHPAYGIRVYRVGMGHRP